MTCVIINRDVKRYFNTMEEAKKKDEYIQY